MAGRKIVTLNAFLKARRLASARVTDQVYTQAVPLPCRHEANPENSRLPPRQKSRMRRGVRNLHGHSAISNPVSGTGEQESQGWVVLDNLPGQNPHFVVSTQKRGGRHRFARTGLGGADDPGGDVNDGL